MARIEPYHYVAHARIGGQRKEDYFYGDDGQVDGLMQIAEQDLSPALRDVCTNSSFNTQKLNALSMMTALLHMRIRTLRSPFIVMRRVMVQTSQLVP
jgi:hypothetical protein